MRHSGGVSLTAGRVGVELTDFDVRLGETPQLFASINGSDEKAAILDLDLSTAEAPVIDGRTITLAGVTARLTQGAADALNGAFGTTAISAGLTFGVATVVTTAR